MLLPLFLPSIKGKHVTTLRVVALAGIVSLSVYLAANTVSFIVQLFDLSSSEVVKFVRIVASLLSRPSLDLEFLPQEFEDLIPDRNGVYAYAPGSYHPIQFRRSSSERGAWEWSDDGRLWLATDNFRDSPSGVPEPPALIFILRLHVEFLIRRRLALPTARHRRMPPPLHVGLAGQRHADAAPELLCCPISHTLMRCPVVSPSGTTFDYKYIRRWVMQHNSDPVDGSPLTEADLYPNLALRDLIERWLRQGAGPPPPLQQQQVQEEEEEEQQQRQQGQGRQGRATGARQEVEADAEGEAEAGATSSGAWRGLRTGLPPHLLDLS